jgi:hypothetical protein
MRPLFTSANLLGNNTRSQAVRKPAESIPEKRAPQEIISMNISTNFISTNSTNINFNGYSGGYPTGKYSAFLYAIRYNRFDFAANFMYCKTDNKKSGK